MAKHQHYLIACHKALWQTLSFANLPKGDVQALLKCCIDKPEHYKNPPYKLLKEHRRTVVYQWDDLVFKRPRTKDKDWWMRLTTLYRKSEVVREVEALYLLNELGLTTPQPIFCAERRKFGQVRESWLVYKYLEGRPIGVEHLQSAMQILERLNQLGYRHDDPNYENFMLDDNGELFLLDTKPRKNWLQHIGLGKVALAHNYIVMYDRSKPYRPEIKALTPSELKQSWQYKLANGFFQIQQSRRWLRKRLKPHKD